ncbi:MAG: matrixin family metalloprotease [Chloroflexi bacterium]|nr:matrixin family metalloprotease [Chloroflexota bacterium]
MHTSGPEVRPTYTAAYDTVAERDYLACHEFGHTLGLRHSGDAASCLFPNSATSGVLTSNEIVELNAHYEIPQ